MRRPDPHHPTAWIERAFLIVTVAAVAVVIAARAGVISFGTGGRTDAAKSSAPAAPAARRTAANAQWASAVCTNLLQWRTTLERDATSVDPGFSPGDRITDAIATTTRTLSALGRLGPPPGTQNAHARAETDHLRAEIARRAAGLQSAASSLTSGNLLAIVTIVDQLKDDTAIAPQIIRELRHVISVDLGVSLVETHACRALVGIPV
jgi:hypothetical protein